ncbi:hypothetical protein KAU11_07315, partial [Candidatus Babeliales bacterium]|nr:hypothetical protein [Candidatus Babeliales bacterium]
DRCEIAGAISGPYTLRLKTGTIATLVNEEGRQWNIGCVVKHPDMLNQSDITRLINNKVREVTWLGDNNE